ncbi:MAG: DUF4190 domain-containing protein [Bacteroidales bacterium]|nr:DUF4190 domain-containing protein [Bacteroidales bacterium]
MKVINESEKKYCTSCGKEVPAQAFFCPHCGAPVGSKAGERYNAGRHSYDDRYQPPRTEPLALISLLVSVFGFFAAGFIGPLVGVILGHVALNRINHSGGELQGHGMATAALIIGYAGLILGVILLAAFGTFFGLAMSHGGYNLPWFR